MLLTMMARPMTIWGQAKATVTDVMNQTWTGVTGTSYIEKKGLSGSASSAEYTVQCAGGNSSIQLRSNNNTSGIVSTTSGGTVTKVVVTWQSSTATGRTLNVYGKNSAYSAASDLYGDNAGTLIGTIVCGTSTELTITDSYEFIGMRSASGAMYLTEIEVTWETGGGGSDPEIHFNGQSANIGTNNPVGTEVSTSFTVYQSNLTEDITFDIAGYGSLNPSSVGQGADATEVTWSYTPTAAGEFNTTITATSGTASATFNIYGEAKAIHTVNIATMTNGSVTASPTSGIQGTNIDLTITPDAGYALETLTVVDGDNNELTVTNNRFQMPDSDVTVSATFVEPAPTTTDVLNYSFIGVTSSSYTSWEDKTGISGAVYAGQSAGGDSNSGACIQLRSNNSNSGIISTTSAGKVKKVTVTWNSATASSRTLNVYGKNTAYSKATDLYASSTQGTLLGTIVNGTSTELTITGDYAYFGLRSASGAMYLDEIDIDWETSGTPTCAAPTFSPAAGTYFETQNVTITSATEGATIYYTLDGNDPTTSSSVYSSALNISETTTVKAMAVKEGYNNSTVSTGLYTITLPSVATPTFTPAAGTYTETQNVTIACATDGATIYYTLDGNDPTTESSVYSTSLSISETTTVKAMAVKSDMSNSEIATAVYNIEQALNTMQAIYDRATEVGNTATSVNIALQNWVVSGVSTNEKNVFVTDGTKGFVIYSNTDMGFAIGNILSGTVSCKVQLFNGFAELTQLNSQTSGILVATGGEVTAANIAMADLAGVNTGALVHYENLTCSVDNSGNTPKYYLTDGTTTLQVYNSLCAFGALEDGKTYNITGIYQQYNTTKEILPRSADDIKEVTPTEPIITVANATVNVEAEGGDGTLTVTYENITDVVAEVWFCNAAGTEDATYGWIIAEIDDQTNNVEYFVEQNDGEERTAYFKVWAYDDDMNEVYSNLVSVTQAEYVAPTYAELPFSFNGGRADIENTDGLSQEGLGSDYSTDYTKLKFDSTDDWLLLQFDEKPGTLTFDIKGNSFSGGTFTVQTSEDDVTYTDLATYTELGNTQNESFDNLSENVRYIKWIYTNKSSGNVGLGNIALAEYVAPQPSITLSTYEVNVDADDHDGTINVTYKNVDMESIGIYFCDENGETATYDWIEGEFDNDNNVYYIIGENTGEARTAYFKVYSMDDETNLVYSELVTVSQAAPLVAHSISIDPNIEHGSIEPNVTSAVEGTEISLTVTHAPGYVIESLTVTEATSSMDVPTVEEGGNYSFSMPNDDVFVTATFVETTEVTYTLVTSIDDLTPGYHYLIASAPTLDELDIMDEQKNNNRGVKTVDVDNNTITLTTLDNYYDFVIGGDATNNWTIYDESYNQGEGGFLYASSSSSNYLKTRTANSDGNSQWSIAIANTGVATIIAQGSNNRNTMQYNSSSSIFACYGTASQASIYLYKKTADTPVYYSTTEITIDNPDPASEPIIVLNNEILTITGNVTCSPDDILIQDGGQLIHNAPINATIQRNVKGYNANRDANNSGYMLIASPVSAPINVTSTNLINGNYDLYIFDEGQQDNEKEWRNYKANEFTTIANTKGYLYANESNGTISFAGELKPSINPVTINLDYTDGNRFAGWNLVGNPFACNAYAYDTIGKSLAFFKMNTTGDGFVAVTTGAIAPMEGIFVKASEAGQNFAFTKEAPVSNPGKGNLNIQVAQANTGRDAQHISDNAIIRFDGGNNLEKFSFNDNGDKLYFTLGNKDYSVFNAEARGEMPVNFKAAENGTYTIDFSMDNVEFSYLHLIDNKTGMDIDLLQTSSYTFEASKIDYASRFKLVFSTNSNSYSNDDNDFAFFDANGNLLILGNEGTATLQVIDITGRTVSNETFSGNYSKAINAKAGVYMLRLIQGNDVRTQKIVVR